LAELDATEMMQPYPALGVAALALGLPAVAAGPACGQTPSWLDSLGYAPTELSQVRVKSDGFPYVVLKLDGQEFWVLFDTGNMVGLTLATPYFEDLSPSLAGTVRRRDSSGGLVGEFRIGIVSKAELLGHDQADARVYEFDDPRLVGLLGPNDLPGTRFTLDYRTGLLAVSSTRLPAGTRGGVQTALVRSGAHPRLVVVEGSVRGRSILIELDTGKSRAVVDPEWAAEAGIDVRGDTVAVGTVRIGALSVEVNNAKPVSLGAIDSELPLPLALGLGSDVLSRYLMTVDYANGVILLRENGQ
jgi:hypothetical protein